VLLQTQRIFERAEASVEAEGALNLVEGNMLPPLPPPFVAPLEAVVEAQRTAGDDPEPVLAQLSVGASKHSREDWQSYEELKELRRQGFRCPGGKYFPPNSGDLLFDCRLWRAAEMHSRDMGQRNFFDHVNPDGADPFARSRAQGFGTYNENIAAGNKDPSGTLGQWKRSDGHCVNMMKAEHNRMAVAYVNVGSSTYKHYWTQLFASTSSSVDTSCYISGGSSGGGGGPCEDKSTHCASWASSNYCQQSSTYYGYMRANCKRSCSFCTSGSPGVVCDQTDPYCESYKNYGYCQPGNEFKSWMNINCPRSCGLCQ